MKNETLRYSLLAFYTLTIIIVTGLIIYYGTSYYLLPLEERFFHPLHKVLKPTGFWGHGFGIIGSLSMLLGVSIYMIRKRVKKFSRVGILKYWLELHIFLCTIGPILVLFHTTFKFGGIVSVAFWSMVAVVASGVIGRFIYVQIPRSIQGSVYSVNELREEHENIIATVVKRYPDISDDINKLEEKLQSDFDQDKNIFYALLYTVREAILIKGSISSFKAKLNKTDLAKFEITRIITGIKNALTIKRKINTLRVMQQLFNYWHVAHLPFALIMLIIMIIHVIVSISFGYTWIF
ncbi:MAG: hypothetical protein SCALA702_34410 [Melioribacteraceae bacterium]|nr:MAG: hypothetical protein SCALA702_34410 [Melioribacteraceae bacterium]